MNKTQRFFATFGAVILVVIVFGVALANISPQARDFERQLLTLGEPPTPCRVDYRKAVLGPGYVVMIHNTSDQSVRFHIHISNDSDSKDLVSVIDAFGIAQFGYKGEWPFAVGDHICVYSDGHAAKTWAVQ